jgi:hypothetical protein
MRIANRYRPFSHQTGTSLLIPGSSAMVTAYPTNLVVHFKNHVTTIQWMLSGLIHQFTVMQDLEDHNVSVSGFSQHGYFRYSVFVKDKKLVVKLDRGPKEGLNVEVHSQGSETLSKHFQLKEELCVRVNVETKSPALCTERISFGVAKSQDWNLVCRRQQPLEYLPFWFALGQTLDATTLFSSKDPSNNTPVELLEKAIQDSQEKNKQESLEILHQIFMSCFHSLLVPSRYDCNYQGLSMQANSFAPTHLNLSLLYQGYKCIRQLLVSTQNGVIHLLKFLPASFHSGRAANFSVPGAMMDIEWSKKQIKTVILTVFDKQTFLFAFQKDLKTFRLKRKSEKKQVYVPCSEELHLEPGIYTFDQFRK